ncbi:probable plastid-lipid-associated protein 4, chloroplastic isoform X2 [Syzygium oleosum]|uniref:probable plastid-lipid-associated protein 4, chloroplastic isoform X2 n=1 Tax=Syzygium oleosum TaxID=219896 RepID=UPI0011D18AE6|nr:probable plastid-lipid-associated protein 4, chloroplastic isoform X2 [Syzygium oleosum]
MALSSYHASSCCGCATQFRSLRPPPPAPPILVSPFSLPPTPAAPDALAISLHARKLFAGARAASFPSRRGVSFFSGLATRGGEDVRRLKEELLGAIAPLDRGAEATPDDQLRVDQIARKLEAINTVKEPLQSDMLNGKWELIYTTSKSVLQTQRPKFLRPNGKIYQAINVDTLRAQNMETWPFFNQVTANLVPLNARRVAVKFDFFRIAGLISIRNPGSGRGQLEITYLDEELRISRGDKGNLFILKMVDPSYRVPL